MFYGVGKVSGAVNTSKILLIKSNKAKLLKL